MGQLPKTNTENQDLCENKLNFRKNFTPLWTAVSKARNFDPYRWEKGTFQPKLDFVDYIPKYVFLVIHQKECKTRIFLSHLLSLYLAMLKSKDATIH